MLSEPELAALKEAVTQCADPVVLHDPQLGFFRDYLLSLGATLPPAPTPVPEPEPEVKPPPAAAAAGEEEELGPEPESVKIPGDPSVKQDPPGRRRRPHTLAAGVCQVWLTSAQGRCRWGAWTPPCPRRTRRPRRSS